LGIPELVSLEGGGVGRLWLAGIVSASTGHNETVTISRKVY